VLRSKNDCFDHFENEYEIVLSIDVYLIDEDMRNREGCNDPSFVVGLKVKSVWHVRAG
jgi:hypothetical protein